MGKSTHELGFYQNSRQHFLYCQCWFRLNRTINVGRSPHVEISFSVCPPFLGDLSPALFFDFLTTLRDLATAMLSRGYSLEDASKRKVQSTFQGVMDLPNVVCRLSISQ